MKSNSDSMMEEFILKLPEEIDKLYNSLSDKVKGFQTFDLLSNLSYYNSLQDIDKYSDYREDRHFFVPEVITLLCLKNSFNEESKLGEQEFFPIILEIQEETLKYCAKKQFLDYTKNQRKKSTIGDITNHLSIDEYMVRNPGLPDHHFLLVKELYSPIEEILKNNLGFTINDSVILRQSFTKIINQRYDRELQRIKKEACAYANEVKTFRKKRIIQKDSIFTIEQLHELSTKSYNEVKELTSSFLLNNLHYSLKDIVTFSPKELSDFTKIDTEKIISFLELFSCKFPSLNKNEEIFTPISLLRTKPILKHKDRFLIPSLPLITWAVEEVVDEQIKQIKSIKNKWSTIKHNYLLNKGIEYFKTILPNSNILPTNLFYNYNDKNCETDGLIIYDKVLFIIEAKGNKISLKSKSGHELKTKDHLDDIIKGSYSQGIRTLNYINEKHKAIFRTKQGKLYTIDKNDFDDIVIISLVFEPLGNLSMLIKATNEIGYFNEGNFPWIISLYDLVIIADLFDNPLLFIQYIKKRKAFLSNQLLSTYEELDLISYFLFNGLNIEKTKKDIEENHLSSVYFTSETDLINDYYMYKFGHKTKFTLKPKSYLFEELNNFLIQMDNSLIKHRVKIALLLLEFNFHSLKQIMKMISKTKFDFSKDGELHDCSIYSQDEKGIGFTFMTHTNKSNLDFELHKYCNYKLNEMKSNAWIGIGDTSKDKNVYNFQSIFFVMKDKISIID